MKRIIKISLLIIVLVCVLLLFITVFTERMHYTGEDVEKELLTLDRDISMAGLIKKGYIDVSGVMSCEDNRISTFLNDVRDRRCSVLRIALITNEKMCVKVLAYDKDLDVIAMWTMYPASRQGESPHKCFSTEPYVIEEKDVVTVYLKNVPDRSIPDYDDTMLMDEKLYSFMKSK